MADIIKMMTGHRLVLIAGVQADAERDVKVACSPSEWQSHDQTFTGEFVFDSSNVSRHHFSGLLAGCPTVRTKT